MAFLRLALLRVERLVVNRNKHPGSSVFSLDIQARLRAVRCLLAGLEHELRLVGLQLISNRPADQVLW